MTTGHFYYIKDEFYNALPNCGLMTNKPDDVNGKHRRPCHYCFEYDGWYWMVPISSQVSKYEAIYAHKVETRGECDGIVFGFVNGRKSAFLIQNAFPITAAFIENEYMVQKGTVPVTVNDDTTKEINKYVRKAVRMFKRGYRTTFTNISEILKYLSQQT